MISRDNTHKKNIINKISNTVGVPFSYSVKLVDDIIFILISNIIKKSYFKIKNFGSFDLKKKRKRLGRNPKNKITYEISERNVLTFKAAVKLSQKVNIDVKK